MDRPRSVPSSPASCDADVYLPPFPAQPAKTVRHCSKCGAPRTEAGVCSRAFDRVISPCPDPTFDYRAERVAAGVYVDQSCPACGGPAQVSGRCLLECQQPGGLIGAQDLRGVSLVDELAVAALQVALRAIRSKQIWGEPSFECSECLMSGATKMVPHTPGCGIGRLLRLVERVNELDGAIPAGKETSQSGERAVAAEWPRVTFGEPWMVMVGLYRESKTPVLVDARDNPLMEALQPGTSRYLLERVAACVNFLAGVPTEMLERERPLADMARPVEQVVHLRRVFPGLPELGVEL